MTLEDHAGDVVGKARKGLAVASGQVADAGGLSAESYASFEEHGTFYFGVRSTPGPQDGRLACLAACSRHAMPDLVYLDPANDYELNDGWYDLQLQDFGMGSFMWAYTSD